MAKSPAFRFYPSDFWGSPDVQAMELHEVGAYMSLLSNAWLGERPGYLSDDDERLRRWAKMTREQWAESRGLLLAKFPVCEDGLRHNPRLCAEAAKQADFSAKQAVNGSKGGRPKAKDNPSLSENNPAVSSGITQTITQKKPSVSVSAAVSVSASAGDENQKQRPSRSREVDTRHEPFRLACQTYAIHKGVTFVWDASEAKQLSNLLSAAPTLSLHEFQECLRHRARSPSAVHAERPRMWLGTILKYQQGPLNQYNQPEGVTNVGNKGKSEQTVDAGRAYLQSLADRFGPSEDGGTQTGSKTLPGGL